MITAFARGSLQPLSQRLLMLDLFALHKQPVEPVDDPHDENERADDEDHGA